MICVNDLLVYVHEGLLLLGCLDLGHVAHERPMLDLLTDLEDGVNEHVRAGRAAWQVDIHRDDMVASLAR